MSIFVVWINSDGAPETFEDKKDVIDEILERYAESGENPVEEVWECPEHDYVCGCDEVRLYSCDWSVELVE